ncbi:MAG: hypothetical protein DRN68_00375 [Thaumarchaeota archaeon]|nr:MAG: hypothetical protein DRN68_00375 [Nitrososphaerota archaeon]
MKISNVLSGLKPHVIYEVLISSISVNGEPNVAPMGLRFSEEFEEFILYPFKSAKTYRNLVEVGEGVVNITRDPRPFVLGCLPELKRELLKDLERSKLVKAPRLRRSEAYIEFKVKEVREESINRVEVICGPMTTYLGDLRIEPYSRAVYALIEASVNASRIEVFLNKSRELLRLLNGVSYAESIIRRTGEGSEYENLFNLLIKSIEKILRQTSSPSPSP